MGDSFFCIRLLAYFSGFFFQAEDGIRDYKVTGVQTCALPISKFKQILYNLLSNAVKFSTSSSLVTIRARRNASPETISVSVADRGIGIAPEHLQRSEERRVGKECRSRWSPYH